MDREALNDFPLGKYDVTVNIIDFEPDREIAWDLGPDIPIPHFYGYRLEPGEDGVTERDVLLRLVQGGAATSRTDSRSCRIRPYAPRWAFWSERSERASDLSYPRRGSGPQGMVWPAHSLCGERIRVTGFADPRREDGKTRARDSEWDRLVGLALRHMPQPRPRRDGQSAPWRLGARRVAARGLTWPGRGRSQPRPRNLWHRNGQLRFCLASKHQSGRSNTSARPRAATENPSDSSPRSILVSADQAGSTVTNRSSRPFRAVVSTSCSPMDHSGPSPRDSSKRGEARRAPWFAGLCRHDPLGHSEDLRRRSALVHCDHRAHQQASSGGSQMDGHRADLRLDEELAMTVVIRGRPKDPVEL